MRLDEVIPSLEEVQGMTMPSQDLAAIHALANKSSQGVSNGEIQPFDICSVDFPPESAPSNCITSLDHHIQHAVLPLRVVLFSFLAHLCVL